MKNKFQECAYLKSKMITLSQHNTEDSLSIPLVHNLFVEGLTARENCCWNASK